MPPYTEYLQKFEEIQADEIRSLTEKEGKIRIMQRVLKNENALQTLHEAIFQGVPVEIGKCLIEGDINLQRGLAVSLEEVEGLDIDRKNDLERRRVKRTIVLTAPIEVGRGTHIRGSVVANKVFFSAGINFSETSFGGVVSFRDATFSKGAHFNRAVFGEGSNFTNAAFVEGAFFVSATFGLGARFIGTTFRERCIFTGATFGDFPSFEYATFRDDATFERATLGQDACFAGATFEGTTTFRGLGPRRGEEEERGMVFSGKVDFRRVTFKVPAEVTFNRVDLRQVRFLDASLDKVQFANVDDLWPLHPTENRKCVYDEIAPELKGVKKDHALLARLYRQLKKNYEEQRAYPEAGDFHYGEMEMTLKQQRKEWSEESKWWPKCKKGFAWFLTRSYKFLSGYGEKAERAIVISLAILLACMLFYFLGDIYGNKPMDPWSAFWDSLISSMGYMTFRLSQPPSAWWAMPVMAVQALFGPIQLALVALALRRRFRR